MNSGVRFLLASLGVILLLIFGIVIINRNSSQTKVVPNTGVNLTEYADQGKGTMQFVQEGPINAEEDHQTIRMTVSAKVRQIDIITGYQGQVTATKSYENNDQAYRLFVLALARAGFNKERRLDDINADSICPLGSRTHYQVIDEGQVKQNPWSASCTRGIFAGDAPLTSSLFEAQFPDYGTLTKNVSMGSSGGSTGLVL